MEKNNNIESKNNPKKSWKWFFTAAVTAWLMLIPVLKWNANTIANRDTKKASSEIFQNTDENKNPDTYYGNFEKIDKDSTAMAYLKNNLFVKWTNIMDPKLNAEISKIWPDQYQIKYDHEFEWLQNYADPTTKKITMTIKFIYKNNNIYMSFEDVKIWNVKLDDNGTVKLSGVIYDYNIVSWENKTLDINSKANKYKTNEMIIEKIKWKWFNMAKIFKEYPEFENTQLTPLNELKLWNEVMDDGVFYYREMNLIQNGKYRPIAKIYFDNHGNIDLNKTNEELNKSNIKILWVDVKFDLTQDGDNLTLTMNKESAKQLLRKVQSDRQAIINVIDKAKIWPNVDFVWFNKENSVRPWSKDKEVWLFKTNLISLSLSNDTYIFQWWKTKDQVIMLTVDSKDTEHPTVNMRNWNGQIVNKTFVTIWNDYYEISLNGDQLAIDKIKKEWQNITEHMPEYTWDKTIANTITNKTNNYFDGNSLEYFTDEWDLVTDVNSKKDEKWYYSLEKQSTDIYIMDLYNYKKFNNITKEIKKYQDKLNTLDIDMVTAFSVLLNKNWINLNNQDVIRVLDKKWDITYCTIDKKFKVEIDEKLYDGVEKSLTTIKDRLETINNLYNSKIRWVNKWQKQDFEKFVWWSRWIWRRLVSQNQILSFVSETTDNIDIELLWWEWQSTIITYNIKKWAIKLNGKSKVTISGQEYKIKIDKENWDVSLDPIEKK